MDPTRETAEQSISVPSQDPEKPEQPESDSKFPSQKKNMEKQTEKEKKMADELSEQDAALKSELELLVERLNVSLLSPKYSCQ